GVVGEARRDRQLRTVPQEAQRDVHADLRAAAREEGATPREVGACVPLGAVLRGAARAELVVEDVDVLVRLLAHVAALRLGEPSGEGAGRGAGTDVDALGLVVDARRGARRRRLDDGAVGVLDRRLGL